MSAPNRFAVPPAAPAPSSFHFALLNGLDAAIRGTLISVMPLVVRDAMGSSLAASRIYFIAGFVSLIWALMVPALNRKVPRQWLYVGGIGLYLCGMAMAMLGTPWSVGLSLGLNAMATATTFVCFNAYVMDYVDRADLGRNQSTQMFFAAFPWAIGPMTGVWLHGYWAPAPFVLAGAFALALMATFWRLRMGSGKAIALAGRPSRNPFAYLGRFFRQPRLIAGWMFAVVRSLGWWVYVVYLPYFCIEQASGPEPFADPALAKQVGGLALSFSNGLLLISPLILRLVRRGSVRAAVRAAFALCAGFFALAFVLSPWPWATVVSLIFASLFLVVLDVVGGLPFLMSVKPSERREMSAIYSSFRDVSSILTPGAAWAVLAVAPTAMIFGVTAAALGGAWALAGRLHPRLGAPREAGLAQDRP